jgi:hypothetical protein
VRLEDDRERLGQLPAVEEHGRDIAGNLLEQATLGVLGEFHHKKTGRWVSFRAGLAVKLDFEQSVGQLPGLHHFGLGRAPRADALDAAELEERSAVVLDHPFAAAIVRLVRHGR